MNKKFKVTSLAVVGAVVTLMTTSTAFAGIGGSGASGVQVQNLTSGAGTAAVSLYNQNGAAAVQLSTLSLAAEGAQNVYLPTESGVSSGSYAMVVSSDVNAAAIARTDWDSTGGAAIYSSVAPGTDILIPLVTKAFAGQTSQFSVQNTDTTASATDVVIQVFGRGSSAAVVTTAAQTIGPGTSKTFNLGDATLFPGLADNSSDLGATGFVGTVRVTSAKQIVVQSFIDIAGTPGVTGFSGVATSSASNSVYCPLIRANYYGDTGISIVNTESTATTVAVTFKSDGASPVQQTFVQTVTVPANSSSIVFQGLGGDSRAAGLQSGTQANAAPTNNGFYGVASLSASGKILAVVNDTLFNSSYSVLQQGTYNCTTAADAGNKFALPLVRSGHLSNTRLTTGIQIQNVGPGSATVSIVYKNWDGTAQSATHTNLTIAEGGSGNFYTGALSGLPTVPSNLGGFGWFGSAVVSSTGGKIVVVVSDETGPGATTSADRANYNAIKIN